MEDKTEIIEKVSHALRERLDSTGVLIMIVGNEIHCVFNCTDRNSIPQIVKGMHEAAEKIKRVNSDLF